MKRTIIRTLDKDTLFEIAELNRIPAIQISGHPSFQELKQYLEHKLDPIIDRFVLFLQIIDRIVEYPVVTVWDTPNKSLIYRLKVVTEFLDRHESRFTKTSFDIHRDFIKERITEFAVSDLMDVVEIIDPNELTLEYLDLPIDANLCGPFVWEAGSPDLCYITLVQSDIVLQSEVHRDVVGAIFQTLMNQGLFRSDLKKGDLSLYLSKMTGYTFQQFQKLLRSDGFHVKDKLEEYTLQHLSAAIKVLQQCQKEIENHRENINR